MIDRRTFLGAVAAAAIGGPTQGTSAPAERLESFTDWTQASRAARRAALQPTIDRILEADKSIRAWVQVRPEPATGTGALDGIPFGAKDIIETKGLSTEYGSPIYKGRIGSEDAAIVKMLRRRGAVLLGKTQTTSFAYRTPAPTRNPRHLDHTPGGSSSGSAASVAAGMVPFALGTQTGGSVLRPASFCGVTGFKPTYGLLPLEGVLPFARSLDTLGLFTHSPKDMLGLWRAMGFDVGHPEDIAIAAPDPAVDAEPEMTAAFARAIQTLSANGVSVRTVDLAPMLARLIDASRTVMFFEGARFHEQRYKEYGDRLDDMAELVRQGLKISTQTYDAARRDIAEARTRVAELYKATPVILVPAAPGPAPRGLASTGDSRMNAPWTALGTPAISIPMPVGAGDLPLGLQLTAGRGDDARVLQTAARLYDLLHGLPKEQK